MKTILLLLIALLLISSPVWAQDRGGFVSIGLHANANQSSANFDNIGLNGQLGYRYAGFLFQADGFGSDNNPARTRYGVAYTKEFRGIAYSGGGGFYRFGQQNGGYGEVGAMRGRWSGFGRVGDQEFVEAEGAYRVATFGNVAVSGFYRFTHHDVNAINWNGHLLGVRFTFSESK